MKRKPSVASPPSRDQVLQEAKAQIEAVLASIKAQHGLTVELRPNVPPVYLVAMRELGVLEVAPITIGLVVVE